MTQLDNPSSTFLMSREVWEEMKAENDRLCDGIERIGRERDDMARANAELQARLNARESENLNQIATIAIYRRACHANDTAIAVMKEEYDRLKAERDELQTRLSTMEDDGK